MCSVRCERAASALQLSICGQVMMNNSTRNNCINVDETVAVAAGAAATTATTTAAVPEFVQLNETRRCIYRVVAAIHDESFNKLMNGLLRQFECAIREAFESAQNSPLLCRKLARNIIALTDQINTVQQRHAVDSSNLVNSVYRQRICFIVAIYIACELCAAQERIEKDRCILERIGSMLSLYVEVGDIGSGALKENTLLTLVAIPKVFGQANIITVLYSRLFPQWSMDSSFFTQIELPDKIYIEYIIIFYCWQRLERDEATKQRIIDFAAKFMRPSSTLPFNSIYINFLPDYGESRTATRCILEHLNVQQACTGLRAASRIDNRSQTYSNDLILDSDEEKTSAESGLVLVSTMTAAITLPITPLPPPAPDPPDFLKALCENASLLEPVKRATALYRGIDSTCEVVDLCESDDDEEMFSLDYSVPANVDGNASSSNEASATVEDDYVPITRIFPSNLRTYQRATSSAANVAAPLATTTETYTAPRIVNSYSCRDSDSLHLVSTTQTPPHLVDQCVQTAEREIEEDQHQHRHHHQQQQVQQQEQSLSCDDDTISTCMFYSDEQLSIIPNSSNRVETSTLIGNKHNNHCHQPSSRNSNSSEASLLKKQVTFSAEHLGASNSPKLKKSLRAIKPSIKRYRALNNITRVSLTPTSSMDHVETLKWMGRKEHLQAGQRMFSKLEAKKYCDKRTSQSVPSSNCRKPLAPDKRPCITPTTQLTPTTSNASSGTPTPQPSRLQSRAPQRSLPTPPASTHSSSGTIGLGKSVCSLDIDIKQLQAVSNGYKFNRRKFVDTSLEHVRFCNNILKLQRIKMQEKRASNEAKTPQKPSQKKSETRIMQTLKRLRASNIKLRREVDGIESDLAIITNYAMEEQAKAATLTKLTAMPIPVVRLKRLHFNEMLETHSDGDENPVEQTSLSQPAKGYWSRRRRRKGHRWSRIKNTSKKKLEAATTYISGIPFNVNQSDPDQSIAASESLLVEPSALARTVSVPPASPAITYASASGSESTPAADSDTAQSSASVTVQSPESATASFPAVIPSDPSQTEQYHGIASYVTLSANGECCDEQDAVVKIITHLPKSSPETEQSSAMVAHEIELATSNVPVYLLNGESRDVTTPLPATLASEDFTPEP
ncbi:hypothetical protein ACLKA7_015305 [Drosophila subpalustris]